MKSRLLCIEPLECRIAPAFAAVFELSSLNGPNGFKMDGAAAYDDSGFSVSTAGDVNGDGFGDLLIGAFGAEPNGSSSGASYVVFGKSGAFSPTLELSTLNGGNGFKISGAAASDRSGFSVSTAGDVNGDGFGDLLIGAFGAEPNGSSSGASYVVFGKSSMFSPTLELSTLNGANGFKISGAAASDRSGFSVSTAGDVNGDGFDDLLIGAYGADLNDYSSGASYVVFGKSGAFSPTLELSTLNGANGFKISGATASTDSGISVSDAGDVNGDGFGDLLISARGADPNPFQSGVSYVVFGKSGGFSPTLELSTLNGANGFKISGAAAGFYAGISVSTTAGDVNGDGFDDLIIGAPGADPNGSYSGASYVVFGKNGAFSPTLELSTLSGANGFKISGEAAYDNSGRSVSTAGDVNGDGFNDLLIGARHADPNGSSSGASYVVFGKSGAFSPTLELATLNGVNGFKINGAAAGDLSGGSVSAAGDVNGDGFGDLLIGANYAHPNGAASGASYVLFGRGIEVNVSDAVANEGDNGTTALQFTVTLSESGTIPVTVKVATANGSALAINDYIPLGAMTLTFAPGETSKTITVDAIGDAFFENDETFSIVLSDATGGVIRDATGLGTIRNNDAPPLISIAGGTVLEGDTGTSSLTFTVSLSAASGLPAAVNFASADGTALAGSDYTGVIGTLNFAPGETAKTITVDVIGDTTVEADETFSVLLSGASNATIANGTGTGRILNDDAPTRPRVQITDASVLEGHSGPRAMTLAVSLSAETTLPISVNFASADGTATAGADYTAITPGTLTFAPGETMKTITVEVLGDIAVEPGETFSVLLSEAVNADIEDGTGLGTILDDDVTLLGKRRATFTDVDGERVTIKVSKGTLKVEDFTIVPSGSGAQLALVDFSGETEFAGANLSITAKRAAGTVGDRLVDVGAIDASGVDLGNVVIKGDLGQIDAGDDRDPRPGLLSLRADSLGRRGLDTQLPGGSLQSDLAGALKSLKLADTLRDATLAVSGDIGAITIKGEVLASTIRSAGSIGAVKVQGDWTASNLVAGAIAGPDAQFGTDDDAPLSRDNPLIGRIASIQIKGAATGTAAEGDHFGFVAEEIGSFKANGAKLTLTRGPANDVAGLPVGTTGDLRVREVA